MNTSKSSKAARTERSDGVIVRYFDVWFHIAVSFLIFWASRPVRWIFEFPRMFSKKMRSSPFKKAGKRSGDWIR